MNKERLFLLAALLILFVTSSCASKNNLGNDRKKLADDLGVSLEDYPPETSFPVTYFKKQLTEGMPIEEVHRIIRLYDQVYRCGKTTEIYYFYGTEDDKALRFMVHYDFNHTYKSLEMEDSDSRYFVTNDCMTGLLQ